jgi:hypothetical protein
VVLTVAEALAWYLIHPYVCMTNETFTFTFDGLACLAGAAGALN